MVHAVPQSMITADWRYWSHAPQAVRMRSSPRVSGVSYVAMNDRNDVRPIQWIRSGREADSSCSMSRRTVDAMMGRSGGWFCSKRMSFAADWLMGEETGMDSSMDQCFGTAVDDAECEESSEFLVYLWCKLSAESAESAVSAGSAVCAACELGSSTAFREESAPGSAMVMRLFPISRYRPRPGSNPINPLKYPLIKHLEWLPPPCRVLLCFHRHGE